jgi:hypothetical protein
MTVATLKRADKSLGARRIAPMLLRMADLSAPPAPSMPPVLPRKKYSWMLWTLWPIDILVALVAVYYFLSGLATATTLPSYIQVWLVLFAILAAVLGGGGFLQFRGLRGWAALVLFLLALPVVGFVLFFLMIIISNPRWN